MYIGNNKYSKLINTKEINQLIGNQKFLKSVYYLNKLNIGGRKMKYEKKDNIREIGSDKNIETKMFSLSGDIVNEGRFEAASNITLYDIIYKVGNGIKNGRKLKAVQLGGSYGEFLNVDHLDLNSLYAIGSANGTGAVLVIDDSHNMVDVLVETAKSFNNKSCGKCTACREGTLRIAELIEKIKDGSGKQKDIEQIMNLAEYMNLSSACPIGPKAIVVIKSVISLFYEDFKAKLIEEV